VTASHQVGDTLAPTIDENSQDSSSFEQSKEERAEVNTSDIPEESPLTNTFIGELMAARTEATWGFEDNILWSFQ
jgi:hypothetical protein